MSTREISVLKEPLNLQKRGVNKESQKKRNNKKTLLRLVVEISGEPIATLLA